MMHIERRHSITLPAPADRVFPLFTPYGETLWVPGWKPEFLYPTTGETQDGMIFRTGQGDQTTLWACCAWDPDGYYVRYARVTPQSRFGFVEVQCHALPDGRTEATIAYAFTALSPEGEIYLQGLGEEPYRRMIEEWRVSISEWLARSP